MNVVKSARNPILYLMLAVGGLLAIGCGGGPRNNPLLDDARASVAAAVNDSAVVTSAPEVLDQAEATLRRAERLFDEGADAVEVEHYAYLTRQHIARAEALAELRSREREIERAELERQQVVLQAREREAEAERREADLARSDTEAALERARELSEQVAELEARQTERGLVLTLSEVLFDVGRAILKEGGQRTVGQLATFLQEYPERVVLVEGHTDITGSLQLNLDLSRRRAEAVKSSLMQRGISGERVRTVGLGPEFPVAGNNTAAGRQQNRRVEIIISDEEGRIIER
jgi:outer membrane protein OmpA-like peptidoglycan-associated protein